jgi:hypothetical protein
MVSEELCYNDVTCVCNYLLLTFVQMQLLLKSVRIQDKRHWLICGSLEGITNYFQSADTAVHRTLASQNLYNAQETSKGAKVIRQSGEVCVTGKLITKMHKNITPPAIQCLTGVKLGLSPYGKNKDWGKLYIERTLKCVLFTKYSQDNQIKDDEMGGTCSTHGGAEKLKTGYKILARKPHGRTQLRTPGYRNWSWRNRCVDTDWIKLDQDRGQRRTPVNTVLNLPLP